MGKRMQYLFRCLAAMCCLLAAVCAQAGADDFATWTGVKVGWRAPSGFRLSGHVEYRTRDWLKQSDRVGISAAGSYGLAGFLQAEAACELHCMDRRAEGWKLRSRYGVGLSARMGWRGFDFSLRERFQQTFFRGETESVLRSRLRAGYRPQAWKFRPYFAVEFFHSVGGSPFFPPGRIRYRPGVVWSLPHSCSLDVFYCRQYEPGKPKDILGVEVGIAL